METLNAIITAARIEDGGCGFLTAWITLDYGDSKQVFGGYDLRLYAGHFLCRTMQVAGVKDWADIVGKTIRVKASTIDVFAIGHITKDDWFNPSADFNKIQP